MAGNRGGLGSSDDVLQNTAGVIGLEEQMAARRAALHAQSGGGGFDGLESRVAKLEAHVEHISGGIDDIRRSLKRLDDLPTKRDLETWRWQWLGIGVVLVAMIIGGIIGGLSWIRPSDRTPPAAAAAAPVIIQVPYPVFPKTGR